MNAVELLCYLKDKDVELWKENGNIRFSAPKNVMSRELLGALSEKKTEILTLLEESNAADHLGQTRVRSMGRNEPFPLTEVQQAYWIGRNNVYDLGGVSCHNYIEVDCPDLDIPRLSAAWGQIVRRHEMLRAVIREDGQQVVLDEVPDYEIRTIDVSGAVTENVDAALLGIREAMSHQVLDVDTWPLFDIRAVKCPNNRTRLHLTFEYLVADAWSINIFVREWIQLYHEPEHAFPPLEFSFREYVLHGEDQKKSREYAADLDYWKKRLPTLPAGPDLPVKVPGGREKPIFVRLSGKLEKTLWQTLKELGKRKKITPSVILLTAFSQILSTWSKKPHFCINLTLFNRLPIHQQINDIVGDFTSLTLLEVDTSLSGTFEEHAHRLQQQLWADMEHRSVGGVHVLRELARERKEGGQIFMPVVFTSVLGYNTLEENDASAYSSLGEVVYNITQTPQVWIDHQVTESNGALQFNWDVVEDIFPQGMIREMFDAYCSYLKHLVQQELFSAPVPLLTPESHLQIRRSINQTETARPEATLHSLFSGMADQSPDRLAVIAPDRSLAYGELDAISNRLAGFLTEKGVKKGSLVAVVMEKGWEQVAAVLGILKAGGVYLPVSLGLPEERMSHILKHGGVALALTRSADGNLSLPSGVDAVSLDAPEIQDRSPDFAQVAVAPDDLAYIIYTSGSTGLPKGVMIDHRGAVNTILDINARFTVTPADRVLALSSLSFDLSVYDIFGTLAAGAALVIPVTKELRDPSYLADLVAREGVTMWNSVPALMEMVADYAASAPDTDLSSIRLALLSGSWIPLDLAGKIRMKAPAAQVVSLGGATEASIWSILYPIDELDSSWESVPYGIPMENQHYLLRQRRRFYQRQ
jgi:non-ribosomal peptide synthetase component F